MKLDITSLVIGAAMAYLLLNKQGQTSILPGEYTRQPGGVLPPKASGPFLPDRNKLFSNNFPGSATGVTGISGAIGVTGFPPSGNNYTTRGQGEIPYLWSNNYQWREWNGRDEFFQPSYDRTIVFNPVI